MQWRGEVKGHKTLAWSPMQCLLHCTNLDLAVKGSFEGADECKQDYNFILGQQWSLKVDHYVSWVNHLARNQNVFMLILGLLQVSETSDKSFRFPVPLCPLTVGFFWLKSTWWTCVLLNICLYLTILGWIVKSIVFLGFITIKLQKCKTCVAYRLTDSVDVIGLGNHKGKNYNSQPVPGFFFFTESLSRYSIASHCSPCYEEDNASCKGSWCHTHIYFIWRMWGWSSHTW